MCRAWHHFLFTARLHAPADRGMEWQHLEDSERRRDLRAQCRRQPAARVLRDPIRQRARAVVPGCVAWALLRLPWVLPWALPCGAQPSACRDCYRRDCACNALTRIDADGRAIWQFAVGSEGTPHDILGGTTACCSGWASRYAAVPGSAACRPSRWSSPHAYRSHCRPRPRLQAPHRDQRPRLRWPPRLPVGATPTSTATRARAGRSAWPWVGTARALIISPRCRRC